MKNIFYLMFCILLAACGSLPTTSPPILVTGVGSTFDTAKENGFKQAIERHVGLILLSEREVTNSVLIKNEILTHSSGYVESFTVLNESVTNGKVSLVMNVVVASSKLANRVLATKTKANVVDGAQFITQHNSFIQNKKQGDALLQKVLASYPTQAYNLTQGAPVFFMDRTRNVNISVPFEMRWNYNYIVAFNEAMSILSVGNNDFLEKNYSSVITMVKPPDAFILGERKNFKFNDTVITTQIANAMLDHNEMHIYWEMKNDQRKRVADGCIISRLQKGFINEMFKKADPFYSTGATGTVINGNVVAKDALIIEIHKYPMMMKAAEKDFKFEMSVVPRYRC